MFKVKKHKFQINVVVEKLFNIPHSSGYCFVNIQISSEKKFKNDLFTRNKFGMLNKRNLVNRENKKINLDHFDQKIGKNEHGIEFQNGHGFFGTSPSVKIYNFTCHLDYKISYISKFPFKRRENKFENKYLVLKVYYVNESLLSTFDKKKNNFFIKHDDGFTNEDCFNNKFLIDMVLFNDLYLKKNIFTELGELKINLNNYLDIDPVIKTKNLLENSKINSILSMSIQIKKIDQINNFNENKNISYENSEDNEHLNSTIDNRNQSDSFLKLNDCNEKLNNGFLNPSKIFKNNIQMHKRTNDKTSLQTQPLNMGKKFNDHAIRLQENKNFRSSVCDFNSESLSLSLSFLNIENEFNTVSSIKSEKKFCTLMDCSVNDSFYKDLKVKKRRANSFNLYVIFSGKKDREVSDKEKKNESKNFLTNEFEILTLYGKTLESPWDPEYDFLINDFYANYNSHLTTNNLLSSTKFNKIKKINNFFLNEKDIEFNSKELNFFLFNNSDYKDNMKIWNN